VGHGELAAARGTRADAPIAAATLANLDQPLAAMRELGRMRTDPVAADTLQALLRDPGIAEYWREYGLPAVCRLPSAGADDFECD